MPRIFIHMELDECINGRRSVRGYRDEAVPQETIDKLLDAGVWAPSGMNGQPWRFVVIEDRDTISKLSKKVKEILLKTPFGASMKERFESDDDTIFYGAPLLILVCVEKKDEQWKQVNFLDCGLTAQNMFLKAYQEGLGSCFIGFGSFLNQEPSVLTEVGVPDDHELIAPLIFGHPNEKPDPKPREIKVLKWIK